MKKTRQITWKQTDDAKTIAKICVAVAILSISLLIILSINIPALQTINENPEYFYASESIGISMYPTLKNGDVLIIQKNTDPSFNVKVGDIIVFTYNDMYVGHRVIDVENNYVVTKGDANTFSEHITYDRIVGKIFYNTNNPFETYIYGVIL